jgi:hypothetical protein
MPSGKIFEIPYWFHAHVVPRRHRNAEKVLLRGSFSFEIPVLSQSDAPVRLRAKLHVNGQPSANNEIILRHDGASYLRAVDDMADEPGSKRPPFTEEAFVAMLQWRDTPWPAIYGERDKLKFVLTTSTEQLSEWESVTRFVRRQPAELQTAAEISPNIRQWDWNGEEQARQDALREIASLVLIDGHLHRRVGAPIAYLSSAGFPHIIHSDEIDDSGRIGIVARHRIDIEDSVMPIAYAPWMAELSRHPNASSFCCEVDAPLENDPRANLAFAIAFAVPACGRWLAHAVEDMTVDGMEAYRAFRDLYARAQAGDYDACIEAMKQMHRMTDGPSFSEADCTGAMRKRLKPKLQFLDALVQRAGLGLDAADEAALSAMAI